MENKNQESVILELEAPISPVYINKITGIEVDEKRKNYNKLLKKYNKQVSKNKELKEIIYRYGLSKIKKESK